MLNAWTSITITKKPPAYARGIGDAKRLEGRRTSDPYSSEENPTTNRPRTTVEQRNSSKIPTNTSLLPYNGKRMPASLVLIQEEGGQHLWLVDNQTEEVIQSRMVLVTRLMILEKKIFGKHRAVTHASI